MLNKLKNNLSTKIILWYMLIFIFVIISTVIVFYFSSTKNLESEVTNTNIAFLKQINQNVDMILKEIDKEAINFVQQPEVRIFMDGNSSDSTDNYENNYKLSSQLINLKFSNSNIYSIYLYSNVKGKILSDTVMESSDNFFDNNWIKDYENMDGYNKWLSTRKVMEDSLFSIQKNIISLIRLYPISNSVGFRKGAMVVNVDEDKLYSIIKNARSRDTDHIFIMDKSGHIISHDTKDMLYNDLTNNNYIFQILTGPKEGYLNEKIDGMRCTVFYITSSYTGWKYISIIPNVEVDKPLATTRNVLITISLFMLAIGLIAIGFVGKLTTRPIERFFHSIRQNIKGIGINGQIEDECQNLDYMERTINNVIKNHESMRKQITETMPIIKWGLLTDLLMGNTKNIDDIRKKIALVNVKLYPSNFAVMVVSIDNKNELVNDKNDKNIDFYIYTIIEKAEDFINQENLGVGIETSNDKAAIIMSFETADNTSNQIRILTVAEAIKDFMNVHLSVSVSIGIGSCYECMDDIYKSYNEAVEALKYKVIMGNNAIISIDDVKVHDERQLYMILPIIDSIISSIRCTNTTETRKQISRMFNEAVKKNIPPDIIREFCMQLVMKATKVMLDAGVDITQLTKRNYNNIFEALIQMETIEQMEEYIQGIFKEYIEKIEERRHRKGNNELIENIISFIQSNYMKYDLTLNSLAETFDISVPYLSKVFKESMGTNFTDYLISIRMEKAKNLLTHTDFKINDIVEKVGYANCHSFIRIFKKYTGKTPGEYRSDTRNGTFQNR
ncbi:MAG: helix-turn-helix domain-containing protein [Clostridiales bacterium]|nr:helix-turn-helix domain-containing protein [Clostridiales bacterium]